VSITALRVFLGVAAGAAITLACAPAAGAYPAGPWNIEGPCAGKQPHECGYTPSPDGLTWRDNLGMNMTINHDKLDNYVCATGPGVPTFVCDGMMAVVRVLPPLPIGQWV
jgi:hypothetical protein